MCGIFASSYRSLLSFGSLLQFSIVIANTTKRINYQNVSCACGSNSCVVYSKRTVKWIDLHGNNFHWCELCVRSCLSGALEATDAALGITDLLAEHGQVLVSQSVHFSAGTNLFTRVHTLSRSTAVVQATLTLNAHHLYKYTHTFYILYELRIISAVIAQLGER